MTDLEALRALEEAATQLRNRRLTLGVHNTMVGVSRQALDDVLTALPRLLAIAEAAERAREALGPIADIGKQYTGAGWALLEGPEGSMNYHGPFKCADLRAIATAHASLTAVLQKGNADE